ncbi:N-acetyltransferase domain-containing protein [Mycena kentingensis (nom. inval.)]|nr:N-acetyltransferase domain-containing protein [Mycena kentingensis (nom. inval.)]
MSDLSTGSLKVRRANESPAAQIAKSLQINEPAHSFVVKLADELDDASKSSIWSIFEENMREMYTTSSFGWDPPTKRAELFDSLSRFILVKAERTLVAFVAFRFEYEHSQNILYCYDLQIAQSSRRRGLGRVLDASLVSIGKDFKLDRVMLTVFKANAAALAFYEKVGFRLDGGSPSDEDEEDYKIFSKKL